MASPVSDSPMNLVLLFPGQSSRYPGMLQKLADECPAVVLPLFQHAFGLSTLLPLAYAVRKTFVCWRLWIVPITVVYAGLPIVLWCEHELLADHFFFATLLWTWKCRSSWFLSSAVRRSCASARRERIVSSIEAS